MSLFKFLVIECKWHLCVILCSFHMRTLTSGSNFYSIPYVSLEVGWIKPQVVCHFRPWTVIWLSRLQNQCKARPFGICTRVTIDEKRRSTVSWLNFEVLQLNCRLGYWVISCVKLMKYSKWREKCLSDRYQIVMPDAWPISSSNFTCQHLLAIWWMLFH